MTTAQLQKLMTTMWGPPGSRDHVVPRKRQRIRKDVRAAVLTHFDGRCAVCGAAGELTIDHLIARRWGGTNHWLNLRPLCRSCNQAKGASLPLPWLVLTA